MGDRATLRVFVVVRYVLLIAARVVFAAVAASVLVSVIVAGALPSAAADIDTSGLDRDARAHAWGRREVWKWRCPRHRYLRPQGSMMSPPDLGGLAGPAGGGERGRCGVLL